MEKEDLSFRMMEILESITDAFYSVDAHWCLTYINHKAEEWWGRRKEDLLGTVLWDMFPESEKFAGYRMHHKALSERVSVSWEAFSPYLKVWVQANAYPVSDGGLAVYFRDITERKQTEQELIRMKEELLQKAEDKYRLLFNSIDQGFFLIDMFFDKQDRPVDMYYLEANAAATTMLGMDFTGKRLSEINPAYEPCWFEMFGKVALTGKSMRMEQYAEPDKKWYSFNIFKVDGGEGHRIGNIFLDITERKKTEEALRESEEQYRSLFNSIDQGFCSIEMMFDEAGSPVNWRYINYNPAFEKQTGWTDVKGKLISDILPETEECWLKTYGDVALTGEPVRFTNEVKALHQWYEVYVCKIGNCDSRRVAVLFNDITKRRNSEESLRISAEELKKADRNKNEFINVMSHELRNPLSAIVSGLSILDVLDDEQKIKRTIEIINRQAKQLRHLVDDLLDISRITNNKIELKKEKVELIKLVNMAIQDFKALYNEKGILLKTEILEDSLFLDADCARITQIISNLLDNSLKFTEKRGETVVAISKIVDEAVICVKDNGIGIHPEDQPKLFMPFVQVDSSLDRKEGGLGLGLSIVKNITELHGGTVIIFSEGLGKGTQSIIRLPLHPEARTEKEENQ